jgi:UDP-N-acetylglucosamine pyrophosphorylase
MSRRYFKKNVDQFDLFDLVAQLSEIKEFRSAEAELSMVYWLRQAELDLIETKKKSTSTWTQVSIESIFDDVL